MDSISRCGGWRHQRPSVPTESSSLHSSRSRHYPRWRHIENLRDSVKYPEVRRGARATSAATATMRHGLVRRDATADEHWRTCLYRLPPLRNNACRCVVRENRAFVKPSRRVPKLPSAATGWLSRINAAPRAIRGVSPLRATARARARALSRRKVRSFYLHSLLPDVF